MCCLKRENHTALLTDPTDGHSLVIPSETRQKLTFPQMVVVHSDKARNTGLISAVIISIASLLPAAFSCEYFLSVDEIIDRLPPLTFKHSQQTAFSVFSVLLWGLTIQSYFRQLLKN